MVRCFHNFGIVLLPRANNLAIPVADLENQKTEAKTGVTILNKMTELGRPVFEQIV